jgi:hypothetical protein
MPHCTFCASGVYMRCFYRQIEAIQFDNVYMLRYYLVEGEERYRSVGLTSRGRLLSVPWMIRKGRVRAVRLSWSEPMNKQTKRIVPAFAAEAEEAVWWYKNRNVHGSFSLPLRPAGRRFSRGTNRAGGSTRPENRPRR